MTNKEIKLECLKLAKDMGDRLDAESTIKNAEELYKFINPDNTPDDYNTEMLVNKQTA